MYERLPSTIGFAKLTSVKRLESKNKKRKYKKEICHWLSPHAGQIFCALGIFAPHSAQYLIKPLSSPRIMSTGLFCIDDIYKN
jgi:hypothetical protein